MPILSERGRDLMFHALGGGSRRPGFRNHFAADPEGDDYQTIQELVADGLMRRGATIPGGLVYFHVTEAGQELMGIKHTKD